MNKEPLVSIIIPFYNRFNLVRVAIESISSQTFKNIEVILIDDGSLEPFAVTNDFGLNIQLKRLDENKGPGCARRVGRQLAKGEYVCYLDSDDCWSDNFIEECVNTIESDLSLGMVYTNTNTIENDLEVNCRVKENKPQNILPTLFIYDKRFWSTASCVWRSEVSLPEHWKDFRNHEDYIHDVLSSKLNNKIKYVKKAMTFKNQSAPERIQRDREEVRKALNAMSEIKGLANYGGIGFFFITRIYEFNIKVKLKDMKNWIVLPFKEYNWRLNKYILFYVLLISFGVIGIKSYKLKDYINLLK